MVFGYFHNLACYYVKKHLEKEKIQIFKGKI